jgi:glyoxylase-like metal-dependent hydrolase (beta-lactamase superfamily II)
MRTISWFFTASLLVMGSLRAAAQEPKALVSRAVQAMGGQTALRGLRSTVVEFNSASFGLGQEETPLSPARATIASGRIATDWVNGRRAVVQEARLVTGAVQRTRVVVRDGMGMTDLNGALSMMPPPAVAGAQRAMQVQPERYLVNALDHPEGLSPLSAQAFRGEVMDGVRYAIGADTMNLWFDRPTGLLIVAETLADDDPRGDRRTLTWYTRWQPRDGVSLPHQVDTEFNGRLQSHNVATVIAVNQVLDSTLFAIPDSMAARAPRGPATPPPVTVQLVELAAGVWRAEGGSHHSLVVDQGTRLLVVEAPQNTVRSNAVIDSLRSRFPGKPIGEVVSTHHHYDHSGGVRGYLARGIPVTTHQRNVAFVSGIASARKTVVPDALSQGGRVPAIRGVSDSLVIGSGMSQVVLYPISSAHAEGILTAYVPSARVLFVVDVITPGPTLPALGSREVAALVAARGIAVERVVGGHGGIATWAQVQQAAK